jgi:hypothetical protein
MRALVLACLVGCRFGNPTIEIIGPADGTTITDHGSSLLEIEAHDMRAKSVELAIDGAMLEENVAVSPRPTGMTCDPCTLRVVWPTRTVGEGLHVISAFVIDDRGEAAVDDVVLTFDDAPEFTNVSPQDEYLPGVGTVNVTLELIERGAVDVDLKVDGVSLGTKTNETCREGCAPTWTWDTRTIAAGDHTLQFTAVDAHGHATETTRVVGIDDLVRVTSIRVTNTVDGTPPLEIEVYAYDNTTNTMLGCAGSMHGLGGVDVSDTRYVVDAALVDPTNAKMGGRQLGTNAVRFEVWEDDDAPVCPAILNPQGNNLVGSSPARTLDQWKALTGTSSFGNVVELGLAFDRPFTR